MNKLKIGILTISDRVDSGKYKDISGPEIHDFLKEHILSGWDAEYLAVPDEYSQIKRSLITLTDKLDCTLVFTTGGTGPAPRDITPEVTVAVCSRILPGFGEIMRLEGLKYIPTAILSRQTAGIRGNSLIINLPGNPKAINQCLPGIIAAIPDCLKLIGSPTFELAKGKTFINH